MKPLYKKQIYKLITSIIIFTALTSIAYAQNANELSVLNMEKLKKADEFYDLLKFKSALQLYLEIVRKSEEDTAILCRIANSYKMLNNHQKAEEWYSKAVVDNASTINSVYKLYFAQELEINGKYNEALFWFNEYNKAAVNDNRALASIKSIENHEKFFNDTLFYSIFATKVSTKFAEFCPAFYKNDIIFLTDRNNLSSAYLNWYISIPNNDGSLNDAVKFDNYVKTHYNDGPLAFFNNNRNVIFCQNYSTDKLDKKRINEIPLQLFSADVSEDGTWKNIQLLPFNNKDFSYTQPSVSSNGLTLYFSSNMSGGFGGVDLYKSEFINGSWDNPVNLGEKINTSGNEMFPFIYRDSTLFFSSNGHGGIGGLDIVKINLFKQDQIEQIGYPINSSDDDFGLILSKGGIGGYFSSNRQKGAGGDDIYGFKVIRSPVIIKIVDEITTLPVPDVEIYSIDNKQIGLTDNNGCSPILLPTAEVFGIRIKKDDYESKVYNIEPGNELKDMELIKIKKSEKEIVMLKDMNNQIINDHGAATYKVQIFASRKEASKKELKRKYKGKLEINKFFEDNWYKYSIGEYSTYIEAKKQLIECNVYDAFIIAYVDNKKVHITIAKSATKEADVSSPKSSKDLQNHSKQIFGKSLTH
jgi:tetratricopeptide (TPR) repeat protein